MMRTRLPYLAVALAAGLGIAACGGVQWTKPGTNTTAIDRDLTECRVLALRRATPPVSARSPESSPAGTRPMEPAVGSNERFVSEHEDIRRCMLARGYTMSR